MNKIQYNDDYLRYSGYQDINPCIQELFDQKTITKISRKVTQLLLGVHPENLPIIVPDHIIGSVVSNIYTNFKPSTGDIYAMYNIPGKDNQSIVGSVVDQAIETIVSDVRNNMETAQNNAKLTIWTTVYGDFNEHGLRQHPPIKIQNRRSNPMEFNMNY